MSKGNPKSAEAFGQRLRELMRAQRHVSPTARSGVDVNALAEAAGTSYEMARRYAEGMVIPRADTLARIAEWLKVAPAVLAWGFPAGDAATEINHEVLQQCLTAVMEAQARTGTSAPTERVAALVSALYQEAMDGRFPRPETVARMLRAMGA